MSIQHNGVSAGWGRCSGRWILLDIKWDGTLEVQQEVNFKTRAEQLAWLRAPTFEPPPRDSDKAAQTPARLLSGILTR